MLQRERERRSDKKERISACLNYGFNLFFPLEKVIFYLGKKKERKENNDKKVNCDLREKGLDKTVPFIFIVKNTLLVPTFWT